MTETATTADRTGSSFDATAADMARVGELRDAVLETVTSADGTPIAYERSGTGPPVVIIGGGLNEKAMFTTLADLLSERFTVFNCDRRGRRDTGGGDREQYSMDREVEDLAAVLAAAGEEASVFANCTGGYIALHAAARGVPMAKLALYEPPYDSPSVPGDDFVDRLTRLVEQDRREDLITVFWSESVGFSDELIANFKQLPSWDGFLEIAPSVVYDAIIDRDHGVIPHELLPQVGVPTLVVIGTRTQDWIKQACGTLADEIPGARRAHLEGAGHLFSQATIVPILTEFLLP